MLSISLTIELRSAEANKLMYTLYSMTNTHRIKDFMYLLTRAKIDEVIIDSLEEQLLKIYTRLWNSIKHSNGRTVTLTLEKAERIALYVLMSTLLYTRQWDDQHFPLSSAQAREYTKALEIRC